MCIAMYTLVYDTSIINTTLHLSKLVGSVENYSKKFSYYTWVPKGTLVKNQQYGPC